MYIFIQSHIMFANIFIFALFLTISRAGYAGSYGGNYVGAGGAGGYGYGYGGAFPPYPQPFFAPIPFDFNTLMAGLNQIQARLQEQAAHSSGLGTAGGYAYSGSYPAPYAGVSNTYAPTPKPFSAPAPPITNGHQGGVYSSNGYSGGYGGGYGGSFGSGGYGGAFGSSYGKVLQPTRTFSDGYSAGASASIGDGGVKQTAYLNPENPAYPNVNVRFGGGSTPTGTSKSVFVSSSSSSGNINGTPYLQRHASTTVNDNGKVSSYTVHDKK